jgi:ribosomal RNA-processing protein 1
MDKYLLLVRRFLNSSFSYFARRGWPSSSDKNSSAYHSSIDAYLSVLRKTPLNPTCAKIPDGLRYHVIDVYIDELDNVCGGRGPLELILEPLRKIRRESHNKKVRERVDDVMKDERLQYWEIKDAENRHLDPDRNGRNVRQDSKEVSVAMVEDVEDEEWKGIDD